MALDTRKLFDSCALLEERVAQLYYLFAELYNDMPDLASLWMKTAVEEENHMRQFELAARLERSTTFSPLVDSAVILNAIDSVTSLISKVRQHPPKWQDSLRFAISLEEKLAQFHVDTAVTYTDATINSLFKAMMTSDEQHVQSLRAYLERDDTSPA